MSQLSTIKNIYFLGIGGIGMSALAHYFVGRGAAVAGYDKTPSKVTQQLKAAGVKVIFEDTLALIPGDFLNPSETLVVYTPAVPSDLKLLNWFTDQNYDVKKRAEVLGDISREMPTLAVAGTHGKTTTSAILAHLLKQSGFKITAFLGGILENYQSNFIGEGQDACVVEADEFDRSFLQLSPQYAAITSMDADHLDVYGQSQELMNTFHQFAAKLTSPERLFYKKGLPLSGNTVAIDAQADFNIHNVRVDNGSYHFELTTPQAELKNIELTLPGRHNLMNAGMALAMALSFGAVPEKLIAGLKTFKGVERRFTYHLKTPDLVVVEDYAHHPKELKAALQAAREMHPGKKITAVFQPHLYSRTRDFAQEFAQELAHFDELLLLPIYPARETPIPGIDSAFLWRLIDSQNKQLVTKNDLGLQLKKSNHQVVMLLGAGDIGNEVERVITVLTDEA